MRMESTGENKDNSKCFVNQINTVLFPLAEYSGLIQFRYSMERNELINLPRNIIQLIIFSTVYALLIYYDLTSAESISVAGEKSTIFNIGIGMLTTVSFTCSFYSVVSTYVVRKYIVTMITSFVEVEKAVSEIDRFVTKISKEYFSATISDDQLRILQ